MSVDELCDICGEDPGEDAHIGSEGEYYCPDCCPECNPPADALKGNPE